MRFQLPQFIEIESKIVGPFTLKQFLWVAAGAAVLFLMFTSLSLDLFIILAIPVVIIFGCLAFLKIDDIPLIVYVSYGLSYLLNPKKYFFKKEQNHQQLTK